MTNIGAFGMVMDSAGVLWHAAGVDAKTGLPKLTKTTIKASRIMIQGANGTNILADDLALDQAGNAAEELRKVFPNGTFEVLPGTEVMRDPSITIMGVTSASTASWFLVMRSRQNPGQSGVAFHPLGVRIMAYLETNGIKGFGDGTSLVDFKKQLPGLIPGLAGEVL